MDASAYEVMVFMSQPWRHLVPLVTISGNYGSAANPGAYAAMRYTSGKLSEFAWDCFFSEWDLKQGLVDMKLSFTGEDLEPIYLPSKYPLFLMSWGSGIGYGLATSSPGFLPQDSMQAVIDLINDPNAKITLYPEDPLGCTIVGKKVFKKFVDYNARKYDEDNLKFRLRSTYSVQGNLIIIHNTPVEVNPNTVYESIRKSVKEGKLDGIIDVEVNTKKGKLPQYSEKTDTVEITIEYKRSHDPHIIMEKLYKITDLEKSFSLNCNYVNSNRNVRYNLRDSILDWINIRRKVLKRMYRLDLNKYAKRSYVLDALIMLFETNSIDKVINIIKTSKPSEAIEKLITKFKISDYQAEKISDMRIRDLSPDSYEKYKKEKKEVLSKIEELQNILKKSKNIDKIIIKQMEEGKKKYFRSRQSKVIEGFTSDTEESLHVVGVTNTGVVKKLPNGNLTLGNIEESSKIIYLENDVSSLDKLFAFTNDGRVFSENISKLLSTSSEGIGRTIKGKLTEVKEFVSSIVGSANSDDTLLFVTKFGIVKQTKLESYFTSSQNSVAIRLNNNDSLVSVLHSSNSDNKIMIYTKNGKCVLFDTDKVSITSRTTVGIQGIKLDDNDEVIGACLISPKDDTICTIDIKGNMKRISLDSSFIKLKRGDSGLSVVADSDELKSVVSISNKDTHIQILDNTGIYDEIDINNIPMGLRISTGDKLLKLGRGDKLMKVIRKK